MHLCIAVCIAPMPAAKCKTDVDHLEALHEHADAPTGMLNALIDVLIEGYLP